MLARVDAAAELRAFEIDDSHFACAREGDERDRVARERDSDGHGAVSRAGRHWAFGERKID